MNVNKFIYLFILFLFSHTFLYAKGNKGEAIKAKQYQGDSFNIGDIQESILNEAQFLSEMGNCWKFLNSDTSILNTDLSNEIGNLIADFSGKFLRNQGSLSAPLGQYQEDLFGLHKHWVSGAPRDDGNGSTSNSNTQMFGLWADASSYSVNDHNSSVGRYTLDSPNHPETRPKSFVVNMFVKVSYECN